MGYDFKSIEEKWEKVWDEKKAFKTDTYDFSKPKFFVMDMFVKKNSHETHMLLLSTMHWERILDLKDKWIFCSQRKIN